jgi:hypothetical protein
MDVPPGHRGTPHGVRSEAQHARRVFAALMRRELEGWRDLATAVDRGERIPVGATVTFVAPEAPAG